jgi:hypothetical protein
MQKRPKTSAKSDQPNVAQQRAKPPAAANPRLAAQTRKILGKHYANKYRVR